MRIGFDFPTVKLNQLSAITKIFLNHIQITYLVVTLSFRVPFEITNMVTLLGNPSRMFSLSLNCLIDIDDFEDSKTL